MGWQTNYNTWLSEPYAGRDSRLDNPGWTGTWMPMGVNTEDWWKDPFAHTWSGDPWANEFSAYDTDSLSDRQRTYLEHLPGYAVSSGASEVAPVGGAGDAGQYDPFLDVDTSGRDAAWDAIQRLLELDFPSFADWMQDFDPMAYDPANASAFHLQGRRRGDWDPYTWDILGTDAYTGLQDLTDILANPPSEADLSAQGDYMDRIRAGARGMELGEYQAWHTEQENLTEEDMAGMGEDERVARQRMMRSIQGEQEERMTRVMSQHIAGGGTLGQGFAQLDQINQGIRDTRLQAELAMINDDTARVLQQFDRVTQQMTQEYEAGLITAQQFMDNLRENRMGALQGYATQITTMVEQNAQYLEMYQKEMDNIKAQIEKEYQIIVGGLGISGFDLTAVIEEFNAGLGAEELEYFTEQFENAEEKPWETVVSVFLDFVGTMLPYFAPFAVDAIFNDGGGTDTMVTTGIGEE